MTITLNGEQQQSDAGTLAALVEALGFAEAPVATALNGTFVPRTVRARTPLNDGDRIEIVAPMQGG